MPDPSHDRERSLRWHERAAAYGTHLFTATGVVVGAWMLAAVLNQDYRLAFLMMVVAGIIDAVDGTLARRFRVGSVCPQINGRTLDDIVDYLSYTFIPIVLLCRAGWLPDPAWGWIAFPLVTSLFGFAHTGAKEEDAGFFRGFPSYWNIVVFYIAVWLHKAGPWWVLAIVLALSVLSVAPVRFVYPNRPPKWLPLFLGGGVFWLFIVLIMIWNYDDISPALLYLSLVYPVLYGALSVYLDLEQRWKRQ